MNKSILIIDDNVTVCLMLKSWLVKKNFNVETATSVKEAKQMVKEQPFDLILSDIRMPETDGFAFLSWITKYDSDILVIMMTGYADIETAVASMKSGAADYISKPIDPEQLYLKIGEAFNIQENRLKRKRFSNDFIKLPGSEYEQVFYKLSQVAENNRHLLIIGDRGTGKASTVKYIYERGLHLSKPLVLLDFDQYTDAASLNSRFNETDEKGSILMEKFKLAKGGLLYIRKVDKLNINLQDELLTILTKQKRDDDFTQIVMSTEMSKRNLQKNLIPKLYYLLEKDCLTLPSLKGKKEAIMYLTSYFLRFANITLDKKIESIDPAFQDKLIGYEWPGNIQELKNCIIKAALLTEGTNINISVVSGLFGNMPKNSDRNISVKTIEGLRKENYEKEKILEALELAKGNKTMAATILNIDRKTLYNKIKLYKVTTSG